MYAHILPHFEVVDFCTLKLQSHFATEFLLEFHPGSFYTNKLGLRFYTSHYVTNTHKSVYVCMDEHDMH